MMSPVETIHSEWQIIREDKWLFSMITWLPPLIFFLLYCVFAQGLPRDLPIGVVDLDKSTISRKLVRTYDADPSLAVVSMFSSPAEGIAAMRNAEIYGLIIIEADTEQDMTLGAGPVVQAYYNSQYLLIGKMIKSAIASAHGTLAVQIDAVRKLTTGAVAVDRAIAEAHPLSTQITSLYNIGKNYAQFLGSAVLPAMWQIMIVMTTVYSLGICLRKGTTSQSSGLPDTVGGLINKLAPYTLIFWLHGIIMLVGMFVLAGWPMHGSFAILICAGFLAVCACQIMAALIIYLTRDSARALSSAAAYAAPGLAFMGVTYPVTDMIYPARVWRSLLPASHYIDIQISQANYGASLVNTAPQFLYLLLFLFPLLLLLILVKRTRTDAQEALI